MADRLTVARPYARAAFAQAKADRRGSWTVALDRAAATVRDERVRALFGSPKVTAARLAEFVSELAGSELDQDGRNFIALLADNGRLQFLPEIAQIFRQMKDEAERVIEVGITSAVPMGAGEEAQLVAALEKRFDRRVQVHAAVDPSLIGGAVVRAGDLTIDGSIKAKLVRLAHELSA